MTGKTSGPNWMVRRLSLMRKFSPKRPPVKRKQLLKT
jgi:hypothetical protein